MKRDCGSFSFVTLNMFYVIYQYHLEMFKVVS